jgi:hypothetical protein
MSWLPTEEEVWLHCRCCNDEITYYQHFAGSRKHVEAVSSVVPQTSSVSGQTSSTQGRVQGYQGMYFDGYHIMIIGHKHLFQVTKILGCLDAPTNLSHGHHNCHSHHRHHGHQAHHSLGQLLGVTVIHKTMHVIKIDWMHGLIKYHGHHIVETWGM